MGERCVPGRELVLVDNPVMRWCLANAVTEIDPAENKKPSKKKSNGRIDRVSATVTALARVLDRIGSQKSDVAIFSQPCCNNSSTCFQADFDRPLDLPDSGFQNRV